MSQPDNSTCSTCGELYTKVPTWRASICSNGFHCCRDCVWVGGQRLQPCLDHKPEEVEDQTRAKLGEAYRKIRLLEREIQTIKQQKAIEIDKLRLHFKKLSDRIKE